jgi:Ca2+-binding RTX toxin-like protein
MTNLGYHSGFELSYSSSSVIEYDGSEGDDYLDLFGSDVKKFVWVESGAGNDTIILGENGSYIYSGRGNDFIVGGQKSNIIDAGSGNDTIMGWGLSNLMFGGFGDDLIYANGDTDMMYGGQGDDIFFDSVFSYAKRYIFDFGVGNDKLLYGDGEADISVSLNEITFDLSTHGLGRGFFDEPMKGVEVSVGDSSFILAEFDGVLTADDFVNPNVEFV